MAMLERIMALFVERVEFMQILLQTVREEEDGECVCLCDNQFLSFFLSDHLKIPSHAIPNRMEWQFVVPCLFYLRATTFPRFNHQIKTFIYSIRTKNHILHVSMIGENQKKKKLKNEIKQTNGYTVLF